MRALAARQHWIVTRLQLLRLGFSESAIDRRISSGRLFPIHRGVYAVGHPGLSREGRYMAAVLAIGPGAVLSHFAAAALWGFWSGPTEPIEVTVARGVGSRKTIRVHSVKDLPDAAIAVEHGIPVTTPARTVLDLAVSMYSDRAFARLVHEAEAQRLVDPGLLRAEISRARPRCPGVRRLANEIADGPKPTRSGLEDAVVNLLRRHGFPPFTTDVRVPGTPEWVTVDVLFEAQKLAIEVDGDRWHGTKFRRKFDARKQAIIEAAGVRVIRLAEDDPQRETETVARIWNGLT